MALKCLVKFIFRMIVMLTMFIAFIMLTPESIMFDINTEAVNIPLPATLDDYKSTLKMKYSSIVAEIPGPESIGYKNGKMITGALDGYLYEFDLNNPANVKRLFRLVTDKQLAASNYTRISRPLGMKFDSKGDLWIVEPYFGIYRVKNVFTSSPIIDLVFDIDQTGQIGATSIFFDDIALYEKSTGGHILYITDVSSKYTLENFVLILAEPDRTGRILRYDTDTGKLDVLEDGLIFPNGIESLPGNKNGFIFSDIGNRSIRKCTFDNNNGKPKMINIISHMASETDNIRLSANGQTFWLAMLRPRCETNPDFSFDIMMRYPSIRRFIIRSLHLFGKILEFIYQFIPFERLEYAAELLKTFKIHTIVEKPGCLMLEIDQNGKFLNSFIDDKCTKMTEVREISSPNYPNERILYLGSFINNAMRKIILTK
uniref:Adipocyte plasma membrane-associated protein-like n=1 Tax=Dermatophagoides pteronyssinus TaxID=6956 RepID=A0A6P6XM23_DERPT|nr:adipocyte plasma membrane-associated protein-like [Dermatophagoides pteronyssinus]